MSLTRVEVRPGAGRGAAVAAALFGAGAEALQEAGDALVTLAPTPEAAAVFAAAVRSADPGAAVATAETPDVDWASAWRAGIRAHTVGFLTVTPPWLAEPFLPGRRIVIEPAMAFGTGDHATTRGVLLLMQDVVRAGDVVADLGAGSAVLAIAAARLGAARVVAIESDPDAIGNAEANVAANDVAGAVTVLEGDAALLLPLVAPVRVVLANIISSVIRDLLPVIRRSLGAGGEAIFSGMLDDEREAMMSAFDSNGFTVVAEITEEGWMTVRVRGAGEG
ncbi:MAG: 50S ribosomal protein L11 methyltransferase [Gemmatimonadota bacterium]|nr:50S ribosomal protein L11 methyltransferase [Gemmatimonadota bacterium]